VRFETRYDRWLVIILGFAALLTCVVLPALYLANERQTGPSWVPFLPWALWMAVLVSTLPQYYILRDDGLFLRIGWRKILLPYPSLAALTSVTDSRSAGVYSMQRIEIQTNGGKRYIIAVAREEDFMEEIARRCPHLGRAGFGLGVTLTPGR